MITKLGVAVVLLTLAIGSTQALPIVTDFAKDPEVDALVSDLCSKEITLLGEASHGDGKTIQLKVALVKHLVNKCGYNAFFIESGIYDFSEFNRKLKTGEPVTPAMIKAAIGKLWTSAEEIEPLISFLFEKAKSGSIVLGGIDDQISSTADYALNQMPMELTNTLPHADDDLCLKSLQRHFRWQYASDSPYSKSVQSKLLTCLASIKQVVNTHDTNQKNIDSQILLLVESLERYVGRGFLESLAFSNARDESMYFNFRSLAGQLPRGRKIIVWCATVHAAKDLTSVETQEKRVPLGAFLHRDYSSKSFALGFSAYSGQYAMVGAKPRDMGIAHNQSIEGVTFSDNDRDVRYLDSAQLDKFGKVMARPINHRFSIASWSAVLDGLFIFREERPPLRFTE
jgi:erythromycin esterase-like protein